ncbi:transposase [Paenibacillus flagellatus]|uniref:Transposase n=1 Tax=Paenibacillus flagellatus TaxID=2211139 RepID=A0A2V5KU70_9BACL|nr:transposase [Paenibacillus flagellatus]PYI52846.1 transposase [Paenibacillus flagellatus]
MSENDRMEPMSGEPVEVGGVYSNEWGREEYFRKGDVFPADPQLGSTAWKLVRFDVDSITGETEHAHLNLADKNAQTGHSSPRGHVDRGDK